MNIDEIIDGLQKAVDEMGEAQKYIEDLKERINALIATTELWFSTHENELPKKGG